MSVACIVLASDLNCCAPGEGRYDLADVRIHLDLSAESEAFGERLPDFHEVAAAGYTRIQTRDGVPPLPSRIDTTLVNAPVQEFVGGGVRARYTSSVLDRHLPSGDAPLELVLYVSPAKRWPTIPRWGPAYLVFKELMVEASSALLSSALGPYEALAENGRAAFAILPEVRRSCTPPGFSAFVCEAHWLCEARSAWGASDHARLRHALDHILAHQLLFVDSDGHHLGELDDAPLAARARTLGRSQALADLASGLQGSRSDEERPSARRKYARPLEAYTEGHRRITQFGIE